MLESRKGWLPPSVKKGIEKVGLAALLLMGKDTGQEPTITDTTETIATLSAQDRERSDVKIAELHEKIANLGETPNPAQDDPFAETAEDTQRRLEQENEQKRNEILSRLAEVCSNVTSAPISRGELRWDKNRDGTFSADIYRKDDVLSGRFYSDSDFKVTYDPDSSSFVIDHPLSLYDEQMFEDSVAVENEADLTDIIDFKTSDEFRQKRAEFNAGTLSREEAERFLGSHGLRLAPEIKIVPKAPESVEESEDNSPEDPQEATGAQPGVNEGEAQPPNDDSGSTE